MEKKSPRDADAYHDGEVGIQHLRVDGRGDDHEVDGPQAVLRGVLVRLEQVAPGQRVLLIPPHLVIRPPFPAGRGRIGPVVVDRNAVESDASVRCLRRLGAVPSEKRCLGVLV